MSDGIDTSQAAILIAIRDRLREQVHQFSELTCFITDEPVPMHAPAETFCTVCMRPTNAPSPYFAGGGADQLTEEGNVIVSVFRRWMGDQPNRGEHILIDESEGLIGYWKPTILRALIKNDWQPHVEGKRLLRDQLRMVQCEQPGRALVGSSATSEFWGMSVSFYVTWDWELD